MVMQPKQHHLDRSLHDKQDHTCALVGTNLEDVPTNDAVSDILVVSVVKLFAKNSHASLLIKPPQKGQAPGPLFCHTDMSPITPYQLNYWLFFISMVIFP